ncbi:hypothetical protein [Brevundimonas naejangsanensis]|uniref:hypothetical protein n=1 Tax=Brevundimonas naejangsanensis TaxID=588932 RepID=UPI0013C4AF6D|nr:hypothetical protein [Brevundimonas naejangsanensis]
MPTAPRKRVIDPSEKSLVSMKILSFSGVASPETLAYLTALAAAHRSETPDRWGMV